MFGIQSGKLKIQGIKAQEILDSRGNPTVRVFVYLSGGSAGMASVPSGASVGRHEALELRDGDKRYNGLGVLKACKNVESVIFPNIRGMDVREQRKIDELMIKLDGTKNKSRLGANAILGVSLACCRAASSALAIPLYMYIRDAFNLKYTGFKMPVPLMNVVNGGAHADNNLSIQEFMIIPRAKSLREAVRCGAEVFHALKNILKRRHSDVDVGDEGGFGPSFALDEDVLKILQDAVLEAGYKSGGDVFFGLDVAASQFYKNKKYHFGKRVLDSAGMRKLLESWARKYPLILIEDGLSEDDWNAWRLHTEDFGASVALVGDDLFVTSKSRLLRGIKEKVANAILIKLNQVGTLTETIDTILEAQKNKYKVAISHRSGETSDTFIADLAVAVNADFIKAGGLSRSERVEKYNRLMEIENLGCRL